MAVNEKGPHRRLPGKTCRSAVDAGPSGPWRLPSMGIYAFNAEYCTPKLEREIADAHRRTTSARTSFRLRCAMASRGRNRSVRLACAPRKTKSRTGAM